MNYEEEKQKAHKNHLAQKREVYFIGSDKSGMFVASSKLVGKLLKVEDPSWEIIKVLDTDSAHIANHEFYQYCRENG